MPSKRASVTNPPRSSAKATVGRLFRASTVGNKIRRQTLFQQERLQRNKDKRARREKREKERDKLGDKAPPKEVPKTIENCRVPDETIVLPDDEEVIQDEQTDEFASYFDRKLTPKVLLTSSDRPSLQTNLLLRELEKCIPNSEIRLRRGVDVKKIIPRAIERGYTDLLVVNEDRKMPNGLLVTHLPDGPTALFKLSSFRRGYDMKGHGRTTSHRPEVILNNFSTRLGHSVARMFASLFNHDPQFRGRQAVTFHNQRDYIFFRHHRYIFRNSKRVGLQELGPRFTLKLRSLQKGTFDSKFGEYIWIHKRKQMDISRRKFHL